MIAVKCPTCAKSATIDRLADLPSFPFCSDRCRLIDLGRWADGVYAIPGAPATTHGQGPPPSMDDEGDE